MEEGSGEREEVEEVEEEEEEEEEEESGIGKGGERGGGPAVDACLLRSGRRLRGPYRTMIKA
jgi:hypothetical protein